MLELPDRMDRPELVAVVTCGVLNQLELKIQFNSETGRTEKRRIQTETKRTEERRAETRRTKARRIAPTRTETIRTQTRAEPKGTACSALPPKPAQAPDAC